MKYYVTIKHPIRGDNIHAIPTGKIRQGQSEVSEVEIEVRIITPGANLTSLWITKNDIHTPPLDT